MTRFTTDDEPILKRIEEAFHTVKRSLGLSYLWTGSLNGTKLQIWATWLFYAVLVDLDDAVKAKPLLPFLTLLQDKPGFEGRQNPSS